MSRCTVGLAAVGMFVLLASAAAADRGARSGLPAPQSRESVAAPGQPQAHWRIFVDDLHLDFRNTGRLRDLLRRLHQSLAQHSATIGIASSGPSLLKRAPVVGIETTRDAIKFVSGNGLKPEDILADPSVDGMRELRERAHTTLTELRATIDRLAAEPAGPKQVLVVSNGFAIARLGPALVNRERTLIVDEGDLHREMAAVVRASVEAGVRVSALEFSAFIPGLLDPLGDRIDEWAQFRALMRNNLRDLTAPTGGVLLIGAESFAAGIAQLLQYPQQRR